MVKEIIKDEFFLKQKSKSCTKEDLYIANELLETIQAYKEQCVGMAANMIGYLKTMMVVLDENKYLILIKICKENLVWRCFDEKGRNLKCKQKRTSQ